MWLKVFTQVYKKRSCWTKLLTKWGNVFLKKKKKSSYFKTHEACLICDFNAVDFQETHPTSTFSYTNIEESQLRQRHMYWAQISFKSKSTFIYQMLRILSAAEVCVQQLKRYISRYLPWFQAVKRMQSHLTWTCTCWSSKLTFEHWQETSPVDTTPEEMRRSRD